MEIEDWNGREIIEKLKSIWSKKMKNENMKIQETYLKVMRQSRLKNGVSSVTRQDVWVTHIVFIYRGPKSTKQ
jgi:hypothetical protein